MSEKSSLHAKVSLRERLRHFTWAWFTLTMSTGGIALLLSVTPHRFRGLDTIGTIVYILDLVLFSALVTAISIRFYLFPGTLSKSLHHPTESLFFPTMFLSIATIIAGMQKYGAPHTGEWLITTMRVLFWIYCACTFLVAAFQYFYLFSKKTMTVHDMTPSWILPVFPVMLAGTVANVIAPSQPQSQVAAILVSGITFQGLGIMVSMLMYPIYVSRLMSSGLPAPNARPGMFIAVGPPSFTALALIGMSNASARAFTSELLGTTLLPSDVLQVLALFIAIFLWSLSLWFLAISLISLLTGAREMSFSLSWWALVFPNVGFTIATIEIGTALKSAGILWLGSAMTILVVMLWLFVMGYHVYGVCTKKIMYPGKDEDQ